MLWGFFCLSALGEDLSQTAPAAHGAKRLADTPPVSAFECSRAHASRSGASQSGDFVAALRNPHPPDAGGTWSTALQMPLWVAAEQRKGRSTFSEIATRVRAGVRTVL